MTCGVTIIICRVGGLEMFLEPFFKVLGGSPLHSTLQSSLPHLTCKSPTSFDDVIFVLGSHQGVFDGLFSFEVYLNPMFPWAFLKLSIKLCIFWTTMCVFFFLKPDVMLFCWLPMLLLSLFQRIGR